MGDDAPPCPPRSGGTALSACAAALACAAASALRLSAAALSAASAWPRAAKYASKSSGYMVIRRLTKRCMRPPTAAFGRSTGIGIGIGPGPCPGTGRPGPGECAGRGAWEALSTSGDIDRGSGDVGGRDGPPAGEPLLLSPPEHDLASCEKPPSRTRALGDVAPPSTPYGALPSRTVGSSARSARGTAIRQRRAHWDSRRRPGAESPTVARRRQPRWYQSARAKESPGG